MHLRDERVVVSLFIILQFLLQKQPSLLPEGLWLLNNLTGMSHNLPRRGPLDTGKTSLWLGLWWAGLRGGVFRPQLERLTFSLPANSPGFCTSLLSLDLIEPLLQLLPVSNVVSVLVGIGFI